MALVQMACMSKRSPLRRAGVTPVNWRQIGTLHRIASALQLAPRGRLRVYCDTNIARFIAPGVVRFLENLQEAAIDLRTGDRMPDLVEEGFGLAIRAVVPPDSSRSRNT